MRSEANLGAQEISGIMKRFSGFCRRRSARAISERTVARYVSIIDMLNRYHSLPIGSVGVDEVARVVTERAGRMSEGKLSPTTFNTEIATLRRWVEFYGEDPSEKRWKSVLRFKSFSDDDLCPRRRLKDTDMLKPSDVLNIISNFRSPEWKALVAVLWDTGCRIGELVTLDYEDVTRDQHGFILHIKQSKTKRRSIRLITPDIGLKFFLPYYLGHTGKGALFQKRNHDRITARAVNKEMYNLRKKLGIKLWPTVFRKSASTHWKKTGLLPDPAIRQRLGHAKNSRMFEAWYLQYGDSSQKQAELVALGVIEEIAVRIEPKKCWRCGMDIPDTETHCTNCQAPTTGKTLFEEVHESGQLERLQSELANVETMLSTLIEALGNANPKLRHELVQRVKKSSSPETDIVRTQHVLKSAQS